jgi:hypothetical protein
MSSFAALASVDAQCEKTRFLEPKVCRLCTLTKPIPESDHACGDCWSLRMAGRALVTCPFYLFEATDLPSPDGKVPIELCYDCAHRDGWTEQLGPICNHPVAVSISELWGVEVVNCPETSSLAGESRWVPMSRCKACRNYRGELINLTGRFTYCGIPHHNSVCPAAGATHPVSFVYSGNGPTI